MSMDDEDQAGANLMIARLVADGVSTAEVKDGRVFFFSTDLLLTLLQKAAESKSEHVSLFIQNEAPKGIN